MSPTSRWIKPPEPDPTLDAFRDGIGELSRSGELVGHLTAVVREFWSPSRPLRKQWWVWLVAVWPDGTRERSIEDYPPWSYVDEMKRGFLECDQWTAERRGYYDFRWLPPAEAEVVKESLSINSTDF